VMNSETRTIPPFAMSRRGSKGGIAPAAPIVAEPRAGVKVFEAKKQRIAFVWLTRCADRRRPPRSKIRVDLTPRRTTS
jgi:hypothetical protein